MAGKQKEGVGENEGGQASAEALGSAPPHRALRPPQEWGESDSREDEDEGEGRSELNFTLREADRYQRAKERRGGA